MNRSASLLTAFVALLALATDFAAAATPVPAALQDWQGWVLKDREYLRCPFIATASADDQAAHRCAWPDTLALNLDSRGGTFSQRWKIYSDSWIVLPGSFEHWPRDVRVDGAAAAVVARAGVPQLRVGAGEHAISGRLAWSTRPESLPVATQTAIVELTLDGRRIEQPERPRGELWLGQRRLAAEPQQLQIQVYRLVQDDIPVRLVMRLRLQVSGDGREELLSAVLPAGFVPLSLEGNLPARLEADGRLRVQLRPGSFDLTLQARGPGVAAVIARPAVSGTWAQE
ncbi:MAG TPA: hypothetical protein VGO41_01515, partial [Steroidobacteraceae bacterium]|nr:hypothetical protein [Steroidobacteraceae bacterium]